MNKKIQYTVRNVPYTVDQALRKKAETENKTLTQILIRALQKEAGLHKNEHEHHDLDFLIGTWVHDSEVDAFFEKEPREINKKI